jgi:folate-binding protein YgfZ
MQSDLNIYSLQDEVLLDFEPGLTGTVSERLEKYVIADDVQIVDVGPLYGLVSVVGPEATGIVNSLGLTTVPAKPFESAKITDPILGEIYIINQSHAGVNGFDLFVPTDALRAIADKLVTYTGTGPALFCGWEALETARIEAGIPRFGADMDDSNIPLEAGLDKSAISFNKGCYIGQEIISRIRTYGQVAKTLRGLRVENDLKAPPVKGDKLFHEDKEVGYITSAVLSPALHSNIALAYVRKEANQTGNELLLRTAGQEAKALIVETPFKSE